MPKIDDNIEIWLPLSINADYSISNKGVVVNKNGKLLKPNYKYYNGKGGIKKPGCVKVYINVNGKQKKCLLHRLMMNTFMPIKDNNKNTVDHIDRNPFNNNLSNLRWATQKEQCENSSTYKKIRIKFTMEDLHKFYLRTKKETLYKISEDIGITFTDLSKLLTYMHPNY